MKSAVLFILFNRPFTAQVVFDEIRRARPPRLYIAADGPRLNVRDDFELCEKTRAIINQVDWSCDVKTLFRTSNLGCREAVSGAIDWFFNSEDEGIILEDDVVPTASFFSFCDLMLDRYRLDEEIMMISGFNPLGADLTSSSYFYSQYAAIWGWASWKSRWKKYDVNIANWTAERYQSEMRGKLPSHVLEYFIDAYEKVKNGKMNTWDYQWSLVMQLNGLLVVKPCANLITNIGSIGTHSNQADANHHISFGTLNLDQLTAPPIKRVDIQEDLNFYHYAFAEQKWRLLMRYALRKLSLLEIIRGSLNK
jgi:hypothetical protein